MNDSTDNKQPVQQVSGRNEKGQFVKGVSGNPEGPRVGQVSIVAAIKRQLTTGDVDTIARNLLDLATRVPEQRTFRKDGKDGEPLYYEAYDTNEVKLHQWAVDTILERLDGKVPQQLTGDSDSPLAFIIDPGKSLTGNAKD